MFGNGGLMDAMGSQYIVLDWYHSIIIHHRTNSLLRRSIMSTIKWTKSSISFANGTSILKINFHNLDAFFKC